MTTRYERIEAEQRLARLWKLGGLAFHATRVQAIAVKMMLKERQAA